MLFCDNILPEVGGSVRLCESTRDKVCAMASFEKLGLDDWLVQQCKSMGLTKPTPIQEKCILPVLEGNDK